MKYGCVVHSFTDLAKSSSCSCVASFVSVTICCAGMTAAARTSARARPRTAPARGHGDRAETEKAAPSTRLLGKAMRLGILAACASISPCTPLPFSSLAWSSGRCCSRRAGRPAPASATLEQLAWLPGEWGGVKGRASIEERWTPAAGGAMLAVSRTIANDRLVAFEFLRIVERDGGLVYIAQPNGRPPTEFVLTKIDRVPRHSRTRTTTSRRPSAMRGETMGAWRPRSAVRTARRHRASWFRPAEDPHDPGRIQEVAVAATGPRGSATDPRGSLARRQRRLAQGSRIGAGCPDPDGAWVHAFLHRKEGDAGNAAYWYCRAGSQSAATRWTRNGNRLSARS